MITLCRVIRPYRPYHLCKLQYCIHPEDILPPSRFTSSRRTQIAKLRYSGCRGVMFVEGIDSLILIAHVAVTRANATAEAWPRPTHTNNAFEQCKALHYRLLGNHEQSN
jgi:hypothetical protein